MAAGKKAQRDPDEVVHVQVKPGQMVVYENHAYGDRATLQVHRRDLDRLAGGAWEEVDPAAVPDVAER